MSPDSSSDTAVGPPSPQRVDFFLPPRRAKNLDAAKIKIVGANPDPGAPKARTTRARRILRSLGD